MKLWLRANFCLTPVSQMQLVPKSNELVHIMLIVYIIYTAIIPCELKITKSLRSHNITMELVPSAYWVLATPSVI